MKKLIQRMSLEGNKIKKEFLLSALGKEDFVEPHFISEEESKVAEIIQNYKMKWISEFKETNEMFFLQKPFSEYQKEVEKKELFDIVHHFPKFGNLHCHLLASTPTRWVFENVILRDDCYKYVGKDADDEFFLFKIHEPGFSQQDWVKVSDLRKENAALFDEQTLHAMSMTKEKEKGSQQERWVHFQDIFRYVSCTFYHESFREYLKETIQRFVDDEIYYAELNIPLGMVYDYTHTFSPKEQLDLIIDINEEAKKEHEDWQGLRIKYEAFKNQSLESIQETIQDYVLFQNSEKYGSYIAGFDLVREEDTHPDTEYFLEVFTNAKEEANKKKQECHFLLHAGESDFSNFNVLDCVLLDGSKRIGHGFNLYRFPNLMPMIKEKGIALEVCPISNHVLGYCLDLRTHPLCSWIAQGLDIVIGNDDPGLSDISGLSHDYLAVLMGTLHYGMEDLLVLKKISRTSIRKSQMNEKQKENAYKLWDQKYNQFLNYVLKNYCQSS